MNTIHTAGYEQSTNMRNFTAPYEYREYPKWVLLPDGSPILVHNDEEEQAAIGEGSAEDLLGETPTELSQLQQEARALGVNFHHRAGPEKLRELISAKRSES